MIITLFYFILFYFIFYFPQHYDSSDWEDFDPAAHGRQTPDPSAPVQQLSSPEPMEIGTTDSENEDGEPADYVSYLFVLLLFSFTICKIFKQTETCKIKKNIKRAL